MRRGGKVDIHKILFFTLLALFVLSFFINWGRLETVREQREISYTSLLDMVEEGKVVAVEIRGRNIKATLSDGSTVVTYAPEDPNLIPLLRKHRVNVYVKPQRNSNWMWDALMAFGPIFLFLIIWSLMLKQMQGGASQAWTFGKSRARVYLDNRPKVTFADVAGVDEAKEELKEVVEFLRNPEKYRRLGARIPRGILLVGPPGTGKTLLARAVAGEAGVPFFSISASEFVEMFVGVGAARVRDLFYQAKKHSPSIIFIDELDAVGRHRGAGLGGGHDEREQTLNQLLVEIDGFEVNDNVIVLAATNRPDILDPALLRPGRFDKQIVVDRPDFKGRLEILKVHARNKKLAPDVNLEVIAKQTPGFVGADLESLLNEAALLAARKGKPHITLDDIEEALEKIIAGPRKKSRILSDKEKRMVAYHEAGHALVAHFLENAEPVYKISIIPRGYALGYTIQLPVEDKYLVSKSEMLDRLAGLLAGRAAEEIVFNEITTGARDDLKKATAIARQMVCIYGMSDTVGPLSFDEGEGNVFLGKDLVRLRTFSEETARMIDKEVKKVIENAYERAKGILSKYRFILDRIVEKLLEVETLTREEFENLIQECLKSQEAQSQPSAPVNLS